MTEDLKKEVLKHLSNVSIGQHIKWQMDIFLNHYPLNDKKANFFLKLKENNEKLGFIYKYIVAAAYQYGIPKVYINETVRSKESYFYWKKLSNTYEKEYKYVNDSKNRMHKLYYNLLIAVNEMIKEKNSRKEKILNLMYKMSNNKPQ